MIEECSLDDLLRRHYRWWTVKLWRWGVKLGPIAAESVRYQGKRYWCVAWLGRYPVYDGVVRVITRG